MSEIALARSMQRYLRTLCVDIGPRHVGSVGNQQATDFFFDTIASSGFDVERAHFDCIDWEHGLVSLELNGAPFAAFAGPYSPPCSVSARIVAVSNVSELEQADLLDRIVLIHGGLAGEQIMPKSFAFYNPDEHRRIVELLERKKPAAIIAATGKNPELAGAWYPFPLFEDGDFDIPSVYMKDTEGNRMMQNLEGNAHLEFESRRIPSTGCNVVARKQGDRPGRLVCFAHIDTKKGTPGALDDASGIATLLGLAELLGEYAAGPTIEIVALNGEDYYSSPGEMLYLESNRDRFGEIDLGINIDAAGYRGVRTAFSLYECPDSIAGRIRRILSSRGSFTEGNPWYQGDHGLFLMHQRPALAITSENFEQLSTDITHTEGDTVDIVDSATLAGVAHALKEVILSFTHR